MIVTFTGIREIDPDDDEVVDLAVLDVLAMKPKELRFGGALGVDTMALTAAARAKARAHLAVYVPFTVEKQPRVARHAIEAYADSVVELDLPDRKSSYLERNRVMLKGQPGVRRAEKADLCVAFTDGRETGGTHATMVHADQLGIPVEVVPVRSVRKNPRIAGVDLTFKAWAFEEYDRAEKLTKLVRQNKAGTLMDPNFITGKLMRLIEKTPALREADAIAAMPRRVPGAPSDMLPIAEALSAKFGFRVRHLGRRARPQGGELIAGRMRFTASEHERTMEYSGPKGENVILLDNVMTSGQTLEGAGRAVRAAGSTPLGLAVLYGASLGAHAA